MLVVIDAAFTVAKTKPEENYVAMCRSEVLVEKKVIKIRTRTQLISH